MNDNEVKLDTQQTKEEGQIIEVPEVIRVKGGSSFETGLVFGLGFWLAFILYGLIGLFIVKEMIKLWLA